MPNAKLSRRDFLRLATLTTAGGIAVACDLDGGDEGTEAPTTSISVAPSTPQLLESAASTASPVGRLDLKGGNRTVWSWKYEATGTLPTDCAEAYLAVGERKIAVRRDGEHWAAEVLLDQGANEVAVICRDQAGKEDRSEVSTFTVELKRRPTAIIQITIEDGAIVLDGSASRPDETGGAAIAQYVWAPRDGNPAPLVMLDAQEAGAFAGQRVTVTAPTTDGEYYATLRVVDAEGREDTGASYFVIADGEPRVPDYDKEAPAWVDEAIVYGVIPRKFGDPAFAGILEKLPYLQELGINTLWLSPINRSPGGDFGYAVVDYFDVNPDFGSKDDFRAMVTAAHAHGIRVLIDFVPNHSSAEHPYFQDAQAHGKESPYYTFYDRDESGAVTHYFDWEHLPNLNFSNPEVERFMIEAFSYWVREHDVDGFRVDVAWGIKERKPDFWLRWRRELKRIKPDLLLLAEAGARDPYYFDNGFDVAYDWTAQVGKWAWEIVWESKSLMTYNLNTALTNNDNGFHPNARIFRFLNNNDTGTRFITTHGEELTRVAAALLLTLPGTPCVYTGDEIGAWFRPYYDELPMTWDEDKYPGLRDYYKRLIALRKERPSLRSLDWQPVDVQSAGARGKHEVYGYLRYLDGAAEPVLVLLNFTETEFEAEVSLPEQFAALAQETTWRDLFVDEPVSLRLSPPLLGIPMPAWGVRVLAPEGSPSPG